MAAYLIADHVITDPAKFDEYRTKATPIIARYGGRYLTKGGRASCPKADTGRPSASSSSSSRTCGPSIRGTPRPSTSR